MAARHELSGMRWFFWLRIQSVRTGVLTGIYLSCVFIAWLDVANRVAELERFAELRDLLAGALLLVVMGIPVLRFRRWPGKLFVAGLTAWTVLTLTYLVTELYFTLLETRMGALHVFMLGAISYGFVAVLDWVFLMCMGVRHQHVAQLREVSTSVDRHQTH